MTDHCDGVVFAIPTTEARDCRWKEAQETMVIQIAYGVILGQADCLHISGNHPISNHIQLKGASVISSPFRRRVRVKLTESKSGIELYATLPNRVTSSQPFIKLVIVGAQVVLKFE